jgi:hypothetical protein
VASERIEEIKSLVVEELVQVVTTRDELRKYVVRWLIALL